MSLVQTNVNMDYDGHNSWSHTFQIPDDLMLSQVTTKFNVKNPTRNQLMFQDLFRKTTRIKNFSNRSQLLVVQTMASAICLLPFVPSGRK